MDLQRIRRCPPAPSPLVGGEKQQMLTLNRRLEGYLGRVRQLEEENRLLRREMEALRGEGGAAARRRAMEEDLRRARLDVEAAWGARARAAAEAGGLDEELRALGLRRRREEEAREQAENGLAVSAGELEEERRAQDWLRGRLGQLEAELELEVRNHRDDVERLRATALACAESAPPPHAAAAPLPGLLALGEEFSQWAARAWHDAAEEYRSQAARLEESLDRDRGRLSEAEREKNQSVLKLRELQREMDQARDVRENLETSLVQQRDRQDQEIQQLQAHLEALEEDRGLLGRQMDALLVDSRGLVQMKMTLGLEVATYRALLDNERLEGEISAPQPRSAYINDLAPGTPWAQQRFQTQLSPRYMNRALSSIPRASPRSKTISTTPIWTQKRATVSDQPTSSLKTEEEPVDFSRPAEGSTSYPKVLQGSVDHFRPQDVHEEVNYAEPFSPPNEQEEVVDVGSDQKDLITTDREEGENLSVLSAGAPETEPVVESVCHQMESSLFGHPLFTRKAVEHSSPTDILGTESPETKSASRFPEDNASEAFFEMPTERAKPQPDFPPPPAHAWDDEEQGRESKQAAWMEEGSSESETEALIEPTPETSPASESQAEESMFHPTELQEEEISLRSMGLAEGGDECNGSWRNVEQLEDKVYLDGAEMDAWDQVIERKAPLKEDGTNVDESESQHMELEEETSPLDSEQEERHIKNKVSPIAPEDGSHMTFELMDTVQDVERQETTAPEEEESPDTSDGEDGNDEEADDSPNASGSWRTELESDSYAQDNTLADTRPLIRYKSDETDANTQASHMDESGSSDGEEGRTGTGAWGGGRSKRFGTMEDLCEEETAGETLDEEYSMGSNRTEDVSAGQDREYVELDADEQERDQDILRSEEQQSDEETEELTERGEPIVDSSEDYNEQNIDGMVEQELENLSIATYTAQFQQSQNIAEEALGTEQTEQIATHDMLDHEDLEQRDAEITSSVHSVILNEPYEYQSSKESSEEVTHVEVFAEEQLFNEEQEHVPEKDKEDEQNLSILTQVEFAEGDISVLRDLNSQPGNQVDINNPDVSGDEDESSNASQCSQPMTRVKSAYADELADVAGPLSEKPLSGHLVERYDRHADQEHLQTEEWEVLEDPSKHLGSDGSSVVGRSMYDTTLEPSQSLEQIPRGLHPELEAQQEEEDIDAVQPLESPDTMPQESNIFQLEESDDRPTTKSKDLHGFFSSDVDKEFWSSALDTGASSQPDGSYDNNAAEQSNHNLAFGGNITWGPMGSLQVANGNTEMETDTAKAAVKREEEEEGRPALAKKQPAEGVALEGERVHSDDSEDEGDSWSSGEE